MAKIQGLCLLGAEDAPAGFATVVEGTYEIDRSAITEKGAGGQILTTPGITVAKLELSKVIGMAKAEVLKFQEPATGIEMTALSNMLLITEDGEAYKLSVGAGSNLKLSIAADAQSLAAFSCTMEFGKVEVSALTITDVVNLTTRGHQKRDVSVTIDAVAAKVNSLEIDTGITIVPSADMSAVRTAYSGYDMDENDPKFSCEISELLETGTNFLGGAAVTGAFVPHDIIVTLANGTAGENIIFTFTDFAYTKRAGSLSYKGERFKGYDFTPATSMGATLLAIT